MIVLDLRFVTAYVLGGLTFLPLCLILVLLHAYISFPVKRVSIDEAIPEAGSLRLHEDDEKSIVSEKAAENLLDKFKGGHEHDVAAGYFAVCRDYVPGGVNGKPPERVTPAGTVVTTESPSVYQSMYRSILNRKPIPSLDIGKSDGRPTKRSNNVFFIVLRHGHLMLYENSEQLEVRHVIPLEYYRISICAGEEELQEGELWIKRNAIQLSRRSTDATNTTKPFYLFSENCCDKEDFYFAMLEQQQTGDRPPASGAPVPLEYDSQHIIGLVQRLHSSEEQLQTRWLNGIIGRLFLALYKTSNVEDYIRQKITKKISRVQKPAFLTGIVLRKIDVGDSAPQITNPKLRELTIHGDCSAEANVHYDGKFKIEIAATARLDLGARFRAREVDLVLAVVVKKLTGMLLIKFKPPPSNRIWISFERMPEMDLSVEPIVSSRQITYGIILRAIQNRIREVIAETLVLPHWDDIPFADSSHHSYRGGIWSDQQKSSFSPANETVIPDDAANDLVGLQIQPDAPDMTQGLNPAKELSKHLTTQDKEEDLSINNDAFPVHSRGSGHPRDTDTRSERPPKALRSTSFASVANPLLSNTHADYVLQDVKKASKPEKDATSTMMAINSRAKADREDAPPEIASPEPSVPSDDADYTADADHDCAGSIAEFNRPADISTSSDPPSESNSMADDRSIDDAEKFRLGALDADKAHTRLQAAAKANKKSIATIGAAGAAAKKWGWGVLARASDHEAKAGAPRAGTPSNPMGRGQPIPPAGQPPPLPNGKRASTMAALTPSRKSLPPQTPLRRQEVDRGARRRQSSHAVVSVNDPDADDGILVVEAPSEDTSKTDSEQPVIREDLVPPGERPADHKNQESRISGSSKTVHIEESVGQDRV